MSRAAARPPRVLLRRLPHGAGLPLPAYATAGSAGLDLPAAVAETVVIGPGQTLAVPTGICLAIPEGFEGQVRPRSGLARRCGLTVLNAPGTIDADYRGELVVLLVNLGQQPVSIDRGMRVAQLVIAPVARAELVEADTLPETSRQDGGFGHTGT
ncbi:MAG: dUTP diphosphatase [Myxococcales bacterium]|nr:dUTP diphosphatase [Myxococcales bacterium]